MRRGLLLVVFALVCSSVFGLLGPSPARAEATFPPGFSVVPIESGQGEWNLTDFAFLPNGALLTTGKNGVVKRVDANGAITQVAAVPVASNGDVGLLGIGLAVDYAATGHVYAVYNYEVVPNKVWGARVSRFTVDNPGVPTAFVNEAVVMDGIEHTLPGHTVGTVLPDPDGTLWVGMGDGGKTPPAAQDLNSPLGKLFHVNPNGTGVGTNPFYDSSAPSSWKSRIWAYGLRNPFRFSLHPDGTPYIGDVGETQREEVDIGKAGANYGWPCWEGTAKKASYEPTPMCQSLYASNTTTPPLWDYGDRGEHGLSVTGGDFALGDVYPEPYANSWFLADWVEQKMWTLETDANHAMTRAPEAQADRANGAFATEIGLPVAIRRSPQGELYYADIQFGVIYRLRFTGGNRPPTVRASAETTFGNPTAKLVASTSSDPDGDALTYSWDFGDGSPASSEPDPVHTYPTATRYTATVTVSDGKGGTASKSVDVVMNDRSPTLLVTAPAEGKRYSVGEPITATAAAADTEDVGLGPDDVQWRADVIHCNTPDHCHTHPGRVSQGAEFSLPYPDHGTDMHVVVNAEVRDSVGHVERRSFEARPLIRTLTLSTAPGSTVYVNNEPAPADGKVPLVVGSQNTMHVLDGYNAVFAAWSDATLERTRNFSMPPADSSLSAQFRTVSLNVSLNPGTPLTASVSVNGVPGDRLSALYVAGCTLGPASGDNGDGAIEVGETWTAPCYLPLAGVGVPSHQVVVSSLTPHGGQISGVGAVTTGQGYRMVATDGGIFSFGDAPFWGSTGGTRLNQPVISMAPTPTGNGYWLVAADGGIFSFGDALFWGSKGGQPLPAPVVSMAPTPTGNGYWLVTANGAVFPFGDAGFHGGLDGVRLAGPIIGAAATRSGRGYWLIAADGGVFAFGDAQFFGSMGGQRLNQPIVGITPTASGNGYWQVALDGGVFAFGDAQFHGSMGGQPLNQPVVGMTVTPTGNGYWQVATDGGIFAFGDAPFFGSMGGTPLNQPVVGITPAVVVKQ